MKVYLGIDGGGSTCRARLVNAKGRVLGEGLAGPANVASDLEGCLAAVTEAARQALDGEDWSEAQAALGLAGANDRKAARLLQDRLPFGQSLVVTDGEISVLGALGPEDGIVAAIGTGSVFVRQLAGRQHQIGGKGLVLGDEASGAWIGRKLLSLALRATDGFLPMTPLLEDVLREMGGAEGTIAFSIRARPSDFAALAGRVTGSEDPSACEIMGEARAECLRAIDVLQAGASLPVVCLGGLAPVFAPLIAQHHRILSPQGTALDGAVLLAQRL